MKVELAQAMDGQESSPAPLEVGNPQAALKTVSAPREASMPSTEILQQDALWERVARRLLDIAGASVGLLLTFPLILYYTHRIRRESPGPMIHRRKVMKRGGGQFFAFKLRTMLANADEILERDPQLRELFQKNYKLQDDPRVTPTGRFLRTSSIDELPQLVNVLRGEMSLVGPRMITKPELEKYGPYGNKLLSVKPGLTGYWQISGRQHVTYEERVLLDMEYIDRRSLWFDLYILFKTPLVVLRRTGAL